jgi:hypothetical protein
MTVARPSYSAVSTIDAAWVDDRQWQAKLSVDIERAQQNQTPDQRRVTSEIARRAAQSGAEAFALTGSTARHCRTDVSDLDYHVVGSRFKSNDLPGDVDVYFGNAERFWSKLRGGDDFVQWTLRFGCILMDQGVFRAGLRAIATEDIWPDAGAKFARLPEMQDLASRLIGMGDRDAAQDQLRAAFTSLARGLLLERRVFPLARKELPDQLRHAMQPSLADALELTIYRQPTLATLREALGVLDDSVQSRAGRVAGTARA